MASMMAMQIKMMICLMIIVSVALVGSEGVEKIPHVGTLIKHPDPSDVLNRDQLLAQLDKVDYDSIHLNRLKYAPDAGMFVAEHLYRAKNKDSTVVYNGLTVAKLIGQNSFNGLTDCSKDSLKKRVEFFAETNLGEQFPNKRTLAIQLYAYQCLQKAAKYCLKHRNKVIEAGINEQQWLDGLEPNLLDNAGTYRLIYFIDLNRPNLAHYIEKGPRPNKWRDEDVRLEAQINTDRTLIAHPEPSDELARDELVAQLNTLHRDSFFRIDEFVADKLYRTNFKACTIVKNGLSVARLVELNSFAGLSDCSQAALKQRARTVVEAGQFGFRAEGLTLGINVYAFKCLHNAVKYCLHKRQRIVEEGINRAQWLASLEDKMWDDFDLERDIQRGKRSKLPDYITGEPESASIKAPINDGTLLTHPAAADELTRDELMGQLVRLHTMSYRPKAEFVLERLYKTRNKKTTEVINGVTVDDLIALNHYQSLNDCSRDALNQRSDLYFRTQPKREFWLESNMNRDQAINFYVRKCLFLLARYCYQNRDELINKGINDESWLVELGAKSDGSLAPNQRYFYFNGNAPELVYFMKFQPKQGALIPHPEPTEELTRDELAAILDDTERYYRIPEFTAEYLYKTSDKQLAIVVNGVSVAQLIELNSFSGPTDCSKEALRKRARTMTAAETRLARDEEGLYFKINVYAFYCLHRAVEHCLKHKNEVIEWRINSRSWLDGLAENVWDENDIVNNIHQGLPKSSLPCYITNRN